MIRTQRTISTTLGATPAFDERGQMARSHAELRADVGTRSIMGGLSPMGQPGSRIRRSLLRRMLTTSLPDRTPVVGSCYAQQDGVPCGYERGHDGEHRWAR